MRGQLNAQVVLPQHPTEWLWSGSGEGKSRLCRELNGRQSLQHRPVKARIPLLIIVGLYQYNNKNKDGGSDDYDDDNK
jgi:hypothetical protein